MKRKDVLLILPSYSVGGAEKVMLSYFNNFKNSSINLTLVFTNNKFKKKINNKKKNDFIDGEFEDIEDDDDRKI